MMKLFTTTKWFSTSIAINYEDLKAGKNLEGVIEMAYGPQGLGILFVKGIPEYPQLRRSTLPLFTQLANLPEDKLKKYARPQIFHSLGWSLGVEKFQGKYDQSKGSYYINCVKDEPETISKDDEKHYSEDERKMMLACNKWVDEIPQIQQQIKLLSKVMMHTGGLLAKQIDSYAAKNIKHYQKDSLYRIITTGRNHIGRILHYYPIQKPLSYEDNWCGWHNDHGSLTALTSAMYVDESTGKETDIKVQSGGLYAKNRFAEMKRIAIPSDMLAFQLGESCQIKTGGYLQATPHCVVASDEVVGKKVGRNTFAIFMQPNHLQIMNAPKGISPEMVVSKPAYKIPQLKDRWVNGMFFKDFHKKTIEYYS